MNAHASFLLARRFSFPPAGESARGGFRFPASPRCTLSSARGSLCQELPHDQSADIADRLPGLGVLKAIFAADEVSVLHAPSIRMEMDNDVQVEAPKSSSDGRHHC